MLALDQRAHRTGAVDADLIPRAAIAGGGEAGTYTAKILVDPIEVLLVSIEIDREVNGAAFGLAKRLRLPEGALRFVKARGVIETCKIAGVPLPHRDDVRVERRQRLNLARRQRRPTRRRIAVVAGDKIQPRMLD